MRSRSRFGSRWEEPQPAGCAPWEPRGAHAGGADIATMMTATDSGSSVKKSLTIEVIPRLRRRVGEEVKPSLDSALEGGHERLRGRHRMTSQSWGSERGAYGPQRARATEGNGGTHARGPSAHRAGSAANGGGRFIGSVAFGLSQRKQQAAGALRLNALLGATAKGSHHFGQT